MPVVSPFPSFKVPDTLPPVLLSSSGDIAGSIASDCFINDTSSRIGNDITPGTEYNVSRVDFYVSSLTGDISTTGFKVEIWTFSGDNLGSLIATSNETVNLQATEWNIFTFSSPVILSIGTKYAVVLKRTDGSYDASNHPNLPYANVNWSTGELSNSYYWASAGTYDADFSSEWTVRLYEPS